MGSVIRFPLERRRSLDASVAGTAGPGHVLVLPVVRIERHELPPPPALTVDPPHRGGDRPKRGRRSA